MDPTVSNLTGAVGTAAAVIIVAWQQFKKHRSEQAGESREIERLLNALADERKVNSELRGQRDSAWEARDQANSRNNEMFRELADLKASNAKLELQVTYLVEQVEYLRGRVNER